MNKKRPVNLDLATLKFPIMAIVSIFHRISGLLLFVLLPFMLYLLQHSLRSQESLSGLQEHLSNPYLKVVLWAFLAAMAYHILAGIRHVLMDMGWGEDLGGARKSGAFVLICSLIMIIFLGVWIW